MLTPNLAFHSRLKQWGCHVASRFRLLACLFALLVCYANAWALNGTWATIPGISPRIQSTMIYDSGLDRLIVVGGSDGNQKLSEAWQMPLVNSYYTWTKILLSTNLAGRIGHTAIYDQVGKRMIVFGGLVGSTDTRVNEVWSLPLEPFIGEWQLLSTTGDGPPATAWDAAVYDSRRNRMIVSGGAVGGGVTNNVYALNLATLQWSFLFPCLARLQFHAAAYDSTGDQMYVFGGEETVGSTATVVNKTFRYNVAADTWSQLFPSNPPPALISHKAVFDPIRREFVVYGGANGSPASGATYRLAVDNPSQYVAVTSSTVAPKRQDFGAAYDRWRSRLMVFGGSEGPQSPQVGLIAHNDTWALPLVASPQWSTTHVRPYGGSWFSEASMVFDPIHNRTLLFGGTTGATSATNSLFALGLDLTPDQWGVPSVSGPPPSARYGHTAIFDYANDRMLVFGGVGGGGFLSDVWALNTSGGNYAWSALSPVGTPPAAREGHTAVYADQVSTNKRMIIFGGDVGGVLTNDVWALNLNGTPTWQPLTTSHAPSARRDHSAVYDYPGNGMYVFGGTLSDGTVSNELYYLNLNTYQWTKTNVQGAKPSARANHAAVISPYQDQQMIVFGGRDALGGLLSDAWVLQGQGSNRWAQLTTPRPAPAERQGVAAAYSGFGAITYAGGQWGLSGGTSENFNDTWILNYNPSDYQSARAFAPVAQGSSQPTSTQASIRIASMSQSQVVLVLSLPGRETGDVKLAIYDTAGRLIRSLGPTHSGDGRMAWDYRNGQGRRVGAGIYFVKTVGEGASLSQKLVVLR